MLDRFYLALLTPLCARSVEARKGEGRMVADGSVVFADRDVRAALGVEPGFLGPVDRNDGAGRTSLLRFDEATHLVPGKESNLPLDPYRGFHANQRFP